jgi:hypothetical protein
MYDWHGLSVELHVEYLEDDCPWDGDGPAPPSVGGVGWLVCVRAALHIDGETFASRASLGGCWGDSAFLEELAENDVTPEALRELAEDIHRVAGGDGVARARARAAVAEKAKKALVGPRKK